MDAPGEPVRWDSTAPVSNFNKDILQGGEKVEGHFVTCHENARICTEETACGLYNGLYVCLCYHTGNPPVNAICERNTVGGSSSVFFNNSENKEGLKSQNSGILLHVLSTEGEKAEGNDHILFGEKHENGSNGLGFGNTGLLVGLIIFVLFLIFLGILIFWKRKLLFKALTQLSSPKTDMRKSDTRSMFGVEHFVVNPTYYDATPLLHSSIPTFMDHHISIKEQIGQGCFGKVFKGEVNGDSVAVKVARKEHYGEVVKEMETMAAFNHPNILKLLGIVSKEDQEAPWLVFEFMEFGDLATLLRSFSPLSQQTQDAAQLINVSTEDLINMASQVADGMSYLASRHFVHRDLAARNCLVGKGSVVKISDFGLSRDVYTCDYYKLGGSRLLPVRWMAPESILYGRFTLESDIWAYGVLLWEMYSWGKQPFYGHSNEEVVELILEGVLLSPPPQTPPTITTMMAGCWKSDPKDRFTFKQISALLKHPTKQGMGDGRYETPISTKHSQSYLEVI